MIAFLTLFATSAIACALLAVIARPLGWVDRREGLEYRKPDRPPVPLVGGASILIALFVGAWQFGGLDSGGRVSDGLGPDALPWAALLAAFSLGLVDDCLPGGLAARTKFAGQLFTGALFAYHPGAAFASASFIEAIGLGLLAVAAMNIVNAYDHADGLAGGAAGLGLLCAAPPLAGAVFGYLLFNTVLRQPHVTRPILGGPPPVPRAPKAMLGDSGSHLLGVLLVTFPASIWFLIVPAVDLARVAILRIREGKPFWRGDRTHIGHRLGAIGLSPNTAAFVATLAVAPPLASLFTGLFEGAGNLLFVVFALVSGAIYFGLLVITEGALEAGPDSLEGADVRPRQPDRESRLGPDAVQRGVQRDRAGSEQRVEDSHAGPFSGDPPPSDGVTKDGPAAGPFAG